MKPRKILSGLAGLLLAGTSLFSQSQYERLPVSNPFDTPPKTPVSLESNWSNLNASEKTAYLEWANIDDTLEIDIDKKCGDYRDEDWEHKNGDPKMPISDSLESQKIGYYGIPTMSVSCIWKEDRGGHAFNGVFIGSDTNLDITDASQWCFYDAGADLYFPIGGEHMQNMEHISIFTMKYNPTTQEVEEDSKIIESDVVNGIPQFNSINDTSRLITQPLKEDVTGPTISKNLENFSYNPGETLSISASDRNFLDSAWISVDDNLVTKYAVDAVGNFSWFTGTSAPTKNKSMDILLSQEERNHKFVISFSDFAGNISSDTTNYTIDLTAPEITSSITPIAGTDSARVNINIVEANPHEKKYSINNELWNYFSGQDTSFNVPLNDGINRVDVSSTDKAGLSSSSSSSHIHDGQAPTIDLSASKDGINYSIFDENPKDAWMKINDGSWESLSETTGSINYNPIEGENVVKVKAVDVNGNESLEEKVFNFSSTKPSISTNLKSEWYTSLPVEVDVNAQDADEISYKINGGEKINIDNGNNLIDFPQGENEISFYVKNLESGIVDSTSYDGIDVDTIAPTITKEVEGNELKISVYDANLDSWEYHSDPVAISAKSAKMGSPQNTKTLENLDGKYFVSVTAYDEAGNVKVDEGFMTFGVTGIEDKVLKDDFKVYPNPVSNTGTFEYAPTGKDVSIDIYNVNGQKLEGIVDKDNDGKVQHDFSNYSDGIYLYQTNTGSSGKIVKQ
jgi:Secretion system C-terminal sorting domain